MPDPDLMDRCGVGQEKTVFYGGGTYSRTGGSTLSVGRIASAVLASGRLSVPGADLKIEQVGDRADPKDRGYAERIPGIYRKLGP